MDKLFAIKRDDGLYSRGGTTPTFGKVPKIWKRRSDIISHLRLVDHDRASMHSYNDRITKRNQDEVDKNVGMFQQPRWPLRDIPSWPYENCTIIVIEFKTADEVDVMDFQKENFGRIDKANAEWKARQDVEWAEKQKKNLEEKLERAKAELAALNG